MITINIFIQFAWPNQTVAATTLISILLTIPPIIFTLILYFKMRRFEDNFYIMKEFHRMTFILVTSFAAYLLTGITPYFGASLYVRAVLIYVSASICLFISIMIQTYWVIHSINKDNKLLLTRVTSRENSISSKSDATFSVSRLMEQQLKLEQTFEDFMNHLSKEWSMELLLAMIEFTQMQNLIKEHSKSDIDEHVQESEMKLTSLQMTLLANNTIPDSYIVHYKSLKKLVKEYALPITLANINNDRIIEFKIKS
eukprot:491391_1